MKRAKMMTCAAALLGMIVTAGYSPDDFSLADLKDYHKEFRSESVGACSASSTKTYEDYRAITDTASIQWRLIHNDMTVDETTGFLVDKDGFIGVAMGYSFGALGTRYYVELDTGIIIPVIKIDAKAAEHAPDGCSAGHDASVIEFVIDSNIAKEYFGAANGLASWGNFNNYEYLRGNIQDIELVLDEKFEEGIVYEDHLTEEDSELAYGDQVEVIEGGY